MSKADQKQAMPEDCSSVDSHKLNKLVLFACSVPSLTFPTLKSPLKERKSSSVFNFLSALSLTPRGQEENTQQRVNSMLESCLLSHSMLESCLLSHSML